MIINDEEILEHWKKYFKQLLLNEDTNAGDTIKEKRTEPVTRIQNENIENEASILTKVENTIKNLKNSKRPGNDHIANEMINMEDCY
ncbi:hypothetical protein Zmor_011714 [Zophobas morio]|uniref:Uncharacterized protein n=1 Tax=Zophobas morio TaxID=2755281 RepID=A0AA38IVX8_9CUCU|nr:hypothetical protein Zmor_011714 [Zophobas morio]